MAWQKLPTGFTDASWTGLRKYRMIDNGDGTISLEDVTEYSQLETSAYDAETANRVNEMLNTLTGLSEAGFNLNEIYQDYFEGQLAGFDETALEYIAQFGSYIDQEFPGDLLEELRARLVTTDPGAHNGIYRGKNLGSAVTAQQYAAISAGTFDGMYIGDYWEIGNVKYRIAAFDYYMRSGDTSLTTHHVVVVPDENLGNQPMNSTDVTTGAYVGSEMYTDNMAAAKAAIEAAFGADHILEHRNYLVNAVNSGRPSAGAWLASKIELMTEQNIYGNKIFGPMSNGATLPTNYTVDKSQFPLFRFCATLINTGESYWLRDVASATEFCAVESDGTAGLESASETLGVRPSFCLKG